MTAPTTPVSWVLAPDLSATAVREPLQHTPQPDGRKAGAGHQVGLVGAHLAPGAASQGREAIDRIEKLIGHKIAGVAVDENAAPAKSENTGEPQRRGKAQKPAKSAAPTPLPKREPRVEERSGSAGA